MTPNEELNALQLQQPVVVRLEDQDSFVAVVTAIEGEEPSRRVVAKLDPEHKFFGRQIILVADVVAWGSDCPVRCINYAGYKQEPGAVWYGMPALIEAAQPHG